MTKTIEESVKTAVTKMTQHVMWRDNRQKMLEDRLTELMTTLHKDWLQEEIERLEGMKKNTQYNYPDEEDNKACYAGDFNYNQALQDNINHYKEELNKLV